MRMPNITTPCLLVIYEDETVKIYGFASDEAMRQACGFAAFP